jgi:hypothetical protein
MATALLEAAQRLREVEGNNNAPKDDACGRLKVLTTRNFPDEHRLDQLRSCARRSIKVLFDSRGAAVLLRNVTADAVQRTSHFFSKFGDVQSAQRRTRSGSPKGLCDVVIMFATGAPAERFIEYAAKEGMPVDIKRTASCASAKRPRNEYSEPECAQWLSEMVNDSPLQKRPAVLSSDGDDTRQSLLHELDAIASGVTPQATDESVKQQKSQQKSQPEQQPGQQPSTDDGKIKRKRIQLEQPSRPPVAAASLYVTGGDEARAEFMDALKEEHARSIVHPSNWGLSAEAARVAAAAAEAAVANMRSGVDISLDEMSLDSASEYDDVGSNEIPGNGDLDSILAVHSCVSFEVALHNVDAALPELTFRPESPHLQGVEVPRSFGTAAATAAAAAAAAAARTTSL